jgi:sugar/nucleoside kinase (ribokinase family)
MAVSYHVIEIENKDLVGEEVLMGGNLKFEDLIIVCGGHAAFDLACKGFASFPEKGKLVRADTARAGVGGPGLAAAVALARLQVKTARFVGTLVRDDLGEALEFLIKKRGVDTTHLSWLGAHNAQGMTSPGTQVFAHEDSDRSFIHALGSNAGFSERGFPYACLDGAHAFHLAGVGLLPGIHGEPASTLLENAKRYGVITVMDLVNPGNLKQGEALPWIEPALPYVDCLTISAAEVELFCTVDAPEENPSEVIDFFHARGVQQVVFKVGKNGMWFSSKQGLISRVPAFKVKGVDSTGAGDAASSAITAMLALGKELEEACHFGAAVGAMVAKLGQGTGALPSAAEILKFMETAERN